MGKKLLKSKGRNIEGKKKKKNLLTPSAPLTDLPMRFRDKAAGLGRC